MMSTLAHRRLPTAPRSSDRLVAGVASGWANRWRVEPTVVRAALGVLALVGGIGVVVYGALMVLSTEPSTATSDGDREPPIMRRGASIACGTAAILVAARAIGLWPGDPVMGPVVLVAAGVALTWNNTGGSARSVRNLSPWLQGVIRVAVGVGLAAAGVISLADRTGGLSSVGSSAAAIAVALSGIGIFAAPLIGRLLRQLDDERGARIREDERAAVAAHLHDSVLQSLVLIQRAHDPKRMAQLARRQERDLRSWLYSPIDRADGDGRPATLHAAVEALTVEIEDDHAVRVEAVVVGDQPLDDAATSLLGALREAITNAARHASVDRVDVFVEADSGELVAYVRDTGCGFEAADVPADRRGISDSIVGRVQRRGGIATIASRPGHGTEVELRVPRRVEP